MNLVVANLDSKYCGVAPSRILNTNEPLMDRKLADLSIQLDEHMFVDLEKVDVVYVCRDECPIDKESIILHDAETAYFPYGLSGSFYCSPEIFSILGKMYKLDFNKLNFTNLDESMSLLTEKILFLLIRLGYKVNVKE